VLRLVLKLCMNMYRFLLGLTKDMGIIRNNVLLINILVFRI